jgi:hypothetical protein
MTREILARQGLPSSLSACGGLSSESGQRRRSWICASASAPPQQTDNPPAQPIISSQKQKCVASVNDTTIYRCTECRRCEGEAGHRAAASGSGAIYDPTTLVEWRSVPTASFGPYRDIPGIADAG